MKKIISILLAVIMIFSAMSFTAFASEREDEKEAATTTHKTDALLNQVANAKEMQVTVKSGSTALGTSQTTYYIKGDKGAYEFTNGFIKVRAVLVDGTAYAYLTAIPFLYVKLDTGLINIDVSKLIKNAMGITDAVTVFESETDVEMEGVTYHVETYNDRAQAKLNFYYQGDTLKILKVTNRTGTLAESTQYTYFDSYSFSVDDSVVKVPTGLDVTPLPKTLFLSLITGIIAA